jgi:hypothetical protein
MSQLSSAADGEREGCQASGLEHMDTPTERGTVRKEGNRETVKNREEGK